MNRKSQIEATLERSLRNQVKVPQLDRRFDAAVFARIAAEESRASLASRQAPAAAPAAARWLYAINVAGLLVVAIVISVFGAQMLTDAEVSVSMTEIFAAASPTIVSAISSVIAGAALLFGFMYTPWARRLRDELS